MTEFVSMKFQAERDSLSEPAAVWTQEGQRGETMKHFTTEEWIDFVNQVVSPSALDEMENHLKQGCEPCQEAVSATSEFRLFDCEAFPYC